MKRTYVALLIDASSSMSSLRSGAVAAFQSMLATVKQRSGEEKQETYVTLISFANRPQILVMPTAAQNLDNASLYNYSPNGSTAMFDAVGLAVKTLQSQPGAKSKDTSFLVMVVTDGEENCSMDYNARTLNTLMNDLQDTDRWTFAFQVPRGYGRAMCQNFGISADNVREWETTGRGIQEMAVANNVGLSNFFTARSKGVTSTRSFYQKVTTDLSDVNTRQLRRQLDDVSGTFKVCKVQAESTIAPFVEARTGRSYIKGSAYYQLMKPEKVQPQKAVVLVDKTTGKIYGGAGARDIVGLPDGEHARVVPGNHSNYEIFVQSTSTNRILPRGTKVLVAKN